MKKLLLVALVCSGCSGVLTNRQSPLRVDGCYWEVPTIDIAVATAAIGTSVAIHEARMMREPDSSIMLGITTMYATSFAISALTGYAEYAYCKGKLPLFKENKDVQDLPQK